MHAESSPPRLCVAGLFCNFYHRQHDLFPCSMNTLINPKEFKMKINVGSIDRILRIIAGLALIALTAAGIIGAWGWIGIVPLLTGIFKFCPAYTLLGINTCPAKK